MQKKTTTQDVNKLLNETAHNIFKKNYFMKLVSNASKNCFLAGSYLSSALVEQLYETKTIPSDIDFLVGEIDLKKLPKDWVVTKHNPKWLNGRYGYKIKTNSEDIDILLFDQHYESQNHKPGINSFLETAPISIQSIAFDLNKLRLIGNIGIKSIIEKRLWFNNQTVLKDDKGYWLNKIKKLADRYNFEADLRE
jgi:hypothetical protein